MRVRLIGSALIGATLLGAVFVEGARVDTRTAAAQAPDVVEGGPSVE